MRSHTCNIIYLPITLPSKRLINNTLSTQTLDKLHLKALN